ncbi:hypothetical protein [Saccharopolyspora hattusasensis]|uniref:WXG100-like domain-containing protein n=1 Tax=Saccharopolyspora hattusasensis TaxID=1128679 RepID=UPI003D98A145
MFSSIMVPEGVRRLFQVLTGEDMTDADEGALFAVADALEAGAAELGEVRALVAELVGKVRTEFSGRAADRFADGLGVFDGLLSSGQGSLLDLAVFVRATSQQVRYVKLMTIYSLELLWLEMAWAMQFAGATGGASLLWLAARMAAMRLWLTRWWGQLFMRLAMMAAGGVAFNVVPDLQAQVQMLGEKSAQKWDRTLTEQAAGMGAFSALVALPFSAVGGLVSNTLTKVLVKGLGDDVDAAILEAAVKKAVAEHAELYPVSAMAKFADAVGKSVDNYAGMQVGTMWLVKMGSGFGDAVAGSLSEFFGEVLYQLLQGGPLTWNPYSLSAGGFETVFSGVGTLAGLALRGKLHPEGPSPYLEGTGRGDGRSDDGGGSGGKKTPLPGTGSGSQTGNIPGSLGKDSVFIPSYASSSSDVDTVFPVGPVGPVDSAAVPVPSGKDSNDVKDGTDGTRGADGGVPGGDATGDVPVLPGSGQHRPGTPPPAYPYEVTVFDSDRPGTPPPPYSTVAGGDQAVPGVHGVAGKSGVDVTGMTTVSSVDVSGVAGVFNVDDSGVLGGGSLDALGSQTPDSAEERSSAGIPHGSGASSDAVFPETVRPVPGVVADPDGGAVFSGRESLPGAVTGAGGPFGVDVVAGLGDSHRQGGAGVSEGSAVLPVEGSHAVSSWRQDGVAAGLAGLSADTVRVSVPAEVVTGGGLAEFVQGRVAGSGGGPVVLVSQDGASAGVVVSPRQGSALARGLGRVVVALTPGRSGRGPRWTVFATDGSRPKPLAGPGGPVLAGRRRGMAGLAGVSVAVPVSGQQTVAPEETPVAQTASAEAASVVGDSRPAATTHDDQVGTGLPGARPASGYRFLSGVNQANYRCGDERFRVNCLEAFVAFHNSLKFGRQFVAGPAGGDRDPARLEVAFGARARPVAGVTGAEGYVRSAPMGVAVPVIYQRQDGSAHLIAGVRAEDGDGHGRVVLLNPQNGEAAAAAELLAATGMWVIAVSGVEVEGEVVLPPSGSLWRGQDGGSGLPAVVTGPERRGGASGPVAGKAGTKGTKRTWGEADQDSRGKAGESSSAGASKRRKVQELAAGSGSGNHGGQGDGPAPTDQAAQQDSSAQQKRENRDRQAANRVAKKVEADRVEELNGKGKGQLNEKGAERLATLESMVKQRKEREQKYNANFYKARKEEAARVAELKEAEKQRKLTSKEKDDLPTLQRKVEQQKKRVREKSANYRKGGKHAAARAAKLEELEMLTQEQRDELDLIREIQVGVKEVNRLHMRVSRGRKAAEDIEALEVAKKRLNENKATWNSMQARGEAEPGGIAGVGASGHQNERDAMVPGGVPEQAGAGAEGDGRDAWSAAVDLNACFTQAMADEEGVQVPQGVADAGVMLDADAYEELVETELTAFLRQDSRDDAAGTDGAGSVARGDDLGFGEPVVGEDVLAGRVEGGGLVAGAGVFAEFEEQKQLTPAEKNRLAELEQKVAKWKEQRRKAKENSLQAKKAGREYSIARLAELKELMEKGKLSEKQWAELELREEIKKTETKGNRLKDRVATLKKDDKEITALKALEVSSRSPKDAARLRMLLDRAVRWAGSEEQLTETRRWLKEKRKELKSMQARGEGEPGGLRVWGQVARRARRMQWCPAAHWSRLGLNGTIWMRGLLRR